VALSYSQDFIQAEVKEEKISGATRQRIPLGKEKDGGKMKSGFFHRGAFTPPIF